MVQINPSTWSTQRERGSMQIQFPQMSRVLTHKSPRMQTQSSYKLLSASPYSNRELSPAPTPPLCHLRRSVRTTYIAPPPLRWASPDTGRAVPLTVLGEWPRRDGVQLSCLGKIVLQLYITDLSPHYKFFAGLNCWWSYRLPRVFRLASVNRPLKSWSLTWIWHPNSLCSYQSPRAAALSFRLAVFNP